MTRKTPGHKSDCNCIQCVPATYGRIHRALVGSGFTLGIYDKWDGYKKSIPFPDHQSVLNYAEENKLKILYDCEDHAATLPPRIWPED